MTRSLLVFVVRDLMYPQVRNLLRWEGEDYLSTRKRSRLKVRSIAWKFTNRKRMVVFRDIRCLRQFVEMYCNTEITCTPFYKLFRMMDRRMLLHLSCLSRLTHCCLSLSLLIRLPIRIVGPRCLAVRYLAPIASNWGQLIPMVI